jgi:hypothetical protein
VAFSDVIPHFLNAISTVNAVMRESKRREVALQGRLDDLTSRIAGQASAYVSIENSSAGAVVRLSGQKPGVPVSTFDLPIEPGGADRIYLTELLENMPPDVVIAKLLPYLHARLRPGGQIKVQVTDTMALMSALATGDLNLAEVESELNLNRRNGMLGLYDERRLSSALRASGFEDVERKEDPAPYQIMLEAHVPSRQSLTTVTAATFHQTRQLV